MSQDAMASYFRLSVRFLDQRFHGCGHAGEPEWPPSPLRAFQALVAAAARQHRGELTNEIALALQWLETESEQHPPVILAPEIKEGCGYWLSVPHNAMDVVARAWSRGNESGTGDANERTHRTMKRVRAAYLNGEAVHYVWSLRNPITDEIRNHVHVLSTAAGGIAAVGWGLDLAFGHASLLSAPEVETLAGERWLPFQVTSDTGWRVPLVGTLRQLSHRHQQFEGRFRPEGLDAPAPLSAFRKIEYRRATEPPMGTFAAFSVLRLDSSGFRAFDPARRGLTVAGMVRGTVKRAAEQGAWPAPKINAFVLGHADSNGNGKHVAVGAARFAYLPLPTVESRGPRKVRLAGSIRRVMLACFTNGCEEELAWAGRMLSGQELIDERSKAPVALLSAIPANEKMVRYYTQPAKTWATVTPVVLPGYDDPEHLRRRMNSGDLSSGQKERILKRLADRIEGLLRKAILQAGLPEELADNAELEWRTAGFWPGTDLADRYGVPDHLKRFPRFHVKVRWRNSNKEPIEVPGPICFGGGRFYGIGLLAPI